MYKRETTTWYHSKLVFNNEVLIIWLSRKSVLQFKWMNLTNYFGSYKSLNKDLHNIITHRLDANVKEQLISEEYICLLDEDHIFKDADLSPRMENAIKFAKSGEE